MEYEQTGKGTKIHSGRTELGRNFIFEMLYAGCGHNRKH